MSGSRNVYTKLLTDPLGRIIEERGDPGPVVLPGPQNQRLLRPPALLKPIQFLPPNISLRTRWMSSVVLMFSSWIRVRSCALLKSRLRSLSASCFSCLSFPLSLILYGKGQKHKLFNRLIPSWYYSVWILLLLLLVYLTSS